MKLLQNSLTLVCCTLVLAGAAWLTTRSLHATQTYSTESTPIVGGTSFSGAAQISPDVQYNSTVSTNATDDFFYFDVTPGQIATVDFISAVTWSGQAYFSLFDQLHVNALANAVFISTQEQPGQFIFVGNNTTPTRYYFRVQGDGAVKDFLFKVTLADQVDGGVASDAGDTSATARIITQPVGATATLTGSIGSKDTEDWYRINVAAGQRISVTSRILDYGAQQYSNYVYLYDAANAASFITYNQHNKPDLEPKTVEWMGNSIASNAYLIRFTKQEWPSGVPLRYQIDVLVTDQSDSGPLGDAGDTAATARIITPTLGILTTYTGTTGQKDADDWFRINAISGMRISVTTTIVNFGVDTAGAAYLYDVASVSFLKIEYFNTAGVPYSFSHMSNNTAPDAYLIRMEMGGGYPGAATTYRITVLTEQQSDASQPDDAGDNFDSARLITPTVGTSTSYVGLQGGADKDDWFRINVLPGQVFALIVTPLDYNNSQNRLSMTLVDQANGQLWSDSVDAPNKTPKSVTYLGNNSLPSAYLLHLANSGGADKILNYKIDLLLTQQSDANQLGDAGDDFDTALLIGPDLDSSTSRIGSADNNDYYRIDLPIAPGDKRAYTFTLDSLPWPANASGSLSLTLYKANRAQLTSKQVNAPLTDPLTLDLTDCDLCYVKVSQSNNVPALRYFFKLVGDPKPSGTPTPGATPPPVVTITPPPPSATPSLSFEPNDDCPQAKVIPTDGQQQLHLFEQPADKDWIKFDVTENNNYLIEVNIPPESQSDVEVELYTGCNQVASQVQNFAYTPGARLEFQATSTGSIYLRIVNRAANNTLTSSGSAATGEQTLYYVVVRDLSAANTQGALIIVSGRLKANDAVQRNIDNVAETVYRLFQKQDYPIERIQFLTTKESSPGRTGAPSKASLQAAITTWALDKVTGGRPLTLYIVDHGDPGKVYLDKPNLEWITPDELNGWLNQLEAAAPGVKINVIIEACNSGSFMVAPGQAQAAAPTGLSKAGRVVITSAGQRNLAYVTSRGAIFSDSFLRGLGNGSSLWTSFSGGRWAAEQSKRGQTPYLDANGNSIPNEKEDEEIASLRGFAFAGTLVGEEWIPFVASVAVQTQVIDGNAEIRAEVRDDVAVNRVWIVVYPPGYIPPQEGNELVIQIGAAGVSSAILSPLGNDRYAINYVGFDQPGTYKVIVYAEDDQGNEARPVSFEVVNGGVTGGGVKVYLPVVTK